MPGAPERAEIWKVQLHARKTPLADDVDFAELGEKFKASGGDIKNAVLKAAQRATTEPGADDDKQIHQRHFDEGMQEVMAAKKVMDQSLFAEGDGSAMPAGINGFFDQFNRAQEGQSEQLEALTKRLSETERATRSLPGIVERFDDAARTAQNQLRADLTAQIGELSGQLSGIAQEAQNAARENAAMRETLAAQLQEHQTKLDDLFTRVQSEREAQNKGAAQWKTQILIAWSIGGAALMAALAALAMALRG